MLVLGVETSCDETAASVVGNGKNILSNVISSSMRHHRKFGGVIPEIATRHHVENIDRVVKKALDDADIAREELSAIAVTQGPGLAGALLTGISFAKSMSYALGIPLLAVDHLKAHIYAALMFDETPDFPFLGLVVSGGHTTLSVVMDYYDFKVIGETLDDAIGEAYDKVARILGLGYPGGPEIDRLAKKSAASRLKYNCRSVKGSLDFSFSGVKTAVLYSTRDVKHLDTAKKAEIASSFQEAVLGVIVENVLKAAKERGLHDLVIGGGVSANSRLRELAAQKISSSGVKVFFPPFSLCSDNAAMTAGLGYHLLKRDLVAGPDLTAKV